MSTKVESQAIFNGTVKSAKKTLQSAVTADLHGFKSPISERRFLLITVDAVVAVFATALALMLSNRVGVSDLSFFATNWYWFPLLIGVWWTFAWLNDLYNIPAAHDRWNTVVYSATAAGIGLGVSVFFAMLLPAVASVGFFAVYWLLLFLGVVVWRSAYLTLSDALLPFTQRVLIVGRGANASVIADALLNANGHNYDVLGFVENPSDEGTRWTDERKTKGQLEQLPELVVELDVHQVVVATQSPIGDSLFNALIHCQANGVPVAWMPDVYEKVLYRIPVEHVDAAWGLYALQDKPIFRRLQLASKRFLDLTIFVLSLPVFMVLLPLLALAIRLDSRGPVFYKQVRAGRGGKPFTIFKFRTMVTDAERNGAQWASQNDSRITRVGKFLRKTRLDELPQIINVLRGDMSFVGPRPERPEFIAELEEQIPYYSTRMMVKPGLTGWAQINYDYGNSIEDAVMKLQYDFYYVRHWSLWMDVYILFRTIAVVLQAKGM